MSENVHEPRPSSEIILK